MADQAWRDRAAKAMGFEFYSYEYSHGDKTSDRPACPDRWCLNGVHQFDADDWRPDESFDAAMMMRDRCEELGLGASFVTSVVAIYADSQEYDPMTGAQREYCAAFATAEQIADAALKVLEDARG